MKKTYLNNVNPGKTRKTLIQKCMEGDFEAWNAFYHPYYNYVFNIISGKSFYGYSLSEADRKELASDVIIKIYEMMKEGNGFQFDRESKRHPGQMATFRAWIYNQIKTVMRTFYRRRQENMETVEFDPEMDADMLQWDQTFLEEREQAIQKKLLELLAKSRTNKRNIEAFQMVVNGRPVPEIAKELDMSENSVHQATSRCRGDRTGHPHCAQQFPGQFQIFVVIAEPDHGIIRGQSPFAERLADGFTPDVRIAGARFTADADRGDERIFRRKILLQAFRRKNNCTPGAWRKKTAGKTAE